MRIALYNTVDPYVRAEAKRRQYIEETYKKIKMLMESEKVDVLFCQEVIKGLAKEVSNYFGIYGQFRHDSTFSGFMEMGNEANSIITKDNHLLTNTHVITAPSKMNMVKYLQTNRRTITTLVKDNTIFMNTHFDPKNIKYKLRHIDLLVYLANSYVRNGNDVVIGGKFNMDTSEPLMMQLIGRLKHIGISRVSIEEPTNKANHQTTSHIFASNQFDVNHCGMIPGDYSTKDEVIFADLKKK